MAVWYLWDTADQPTTVNYARFPWNAAMMKYETRGYTDGILAYKTIHHWKISHVGVNVQWPKIKGNPAIEIQSLSTDFKM